ncbi:MAG: OmpA family protein, partial [Leptospiraceae bacterium]|nr:OmpA family protein [Leptospiraceae bacterium]
MRLPVVYTIASFLTLLACTGTQKTSPPPQSEQPVMDSQNRSVPEAVDPASLPVGTGSDDGRFTLGVRGQRIMYGYPIPTSTSHFVLNVDGDLATNAPHLGVTHLSGTNQRVSLYGITVEEITFTFHGIALIQRLVPLGRTLQPENNPDSVQYYRIEYEARNDFSEPQTISLQLLLDTMIDDNDAATMQVGRTLLRSETRLTGKQIPDRILVYRTAGQTSDLTGEILFSSGGATRPEYVSIGRWPYFFSQTWDFPTGRGHYGDSAVFIRWAPAKVEPGRSSSNAVLYGLQAQSPSGLSVLFNEKLKQKKLRVYFERNSHRLTAESRRSIEEFVQAAGMDSIVGAIAEGSADYPGDARTNFHIALARTRSVAAVLEQIGIARSRIIPKVRGEAGVSRVPA